MWNRFYVRFSLRLLLLLVVLTSTFVYFSPNVVEGTPTCHAWSLHSHFVEGLRGIMGGWVYVNTYRHYRYCRLFTEKAPMRCF